MAKTRYNFSPQIKSSTDRSERLIPANNGSQGIDGIIPPADELERYEKIHPGFAKIVLDEYCALSATRREIELYNTKWNTRCYLTGIFFGAIISLFAIYIGACLVQEGHEIGGGIIGVAALTKLISQFIHGIRLRYEERTLRNERNMAVADR